VKALVQWEDSLIKPCQSQNRISGFSTDSVLKPLILFCDWHGLIKESLILFCDWRGLIKESSRYQSHHDISIYYLLKALEPRVLNPTLRSTQISKQSSQQPVYKHEDSFPNFMSESIEFSKVLKKQMCKCIKTAG
jgi:hypothetical protein